MEINNIKIHKNISIIEGFYIPILHIMSIGDVNGINERTFMKILSVPLPVVTIFKVVINTKTTINIKGITMVFTSKKIL